LAEVGVVCKKRRQQSNQPSPLIAGVCFGRPLDFSQVIVTPTQSLAHLSKRLTPTFALLGVARTDEPTPFDFLVNAEFLRSNLSSHLDTRGISREEVVDVEYV